MTPTRPPNASDPRCTVCSAYGNAMQLGAIPSQVGELSGLAASSKHPGILYAHNDSGDTARFFALSEAASFQAELHLVTQLPPTGKT